MKIEKKYRITDVVEMLADGNTASDIARKLGYSQKTIEKDIEVLKLAHEAKNTPNLIAIAFRKKMIK